MYLVLLTLGQCVLYFIFAFLYAVFFEGRRPAFGRMSFVSLGLIAAVSMGSYFVSFLMPGFEWSNRAMHVLGGGVMTLTVCFLSVRDFMIPLSKFQFFVFSFFVVTTIGVGNEILEYFMQNYFGITFSATISDTWLDLMSNAVGALLAGAVLTPFITKNAP